MRKCVYFIIGVLTFCGISDLHAVRTEKLNIKGGLVVEGHIVRQTLGKSVTFSVERTYATVNSSWVSRRTDENIKISELREPWKAWAEEQQNLIQKKEITLSTIKIANRETMHSVKSAWPTDSVKAVVLSSLFYGDSHQVYVEEEGAYLRFVDLTPTEVLINLSDIQSIEYKEREATAINGIMDVVEVKGDVFKGQIIEKVLGQLIRMRTIDGKIRSILNKDINCQRKEALNPDYPILKQAEYLDDINGTVGLIVFQKNDPDNPYILMKEENNNEKRFDLKDVKSIVNYKNKNYVPLNDILIKDNEVYFNRQVVSPLTCTKNKKGLFILENDNISKMKEINIESNDKELSVEMMNTENNKSAILFPISRYEEDKESVFAFSYEDVLSKSIAAKQETVSKNNTLRKVYKVNRGFYALYIPKTGMSYFCEVK